MTALPHLIDLTARSEQLRGEVDSSDGSRLDHLPVRWLQPVEVVFDQLAQAPRKISIGPAFCGGVEQGTEKQRVSPRAAVQRLHGVGRRRIDFSSRDQLGGRLQGQWLEPDVRGKSTDNQGGHTG